MQQNVRSECPKCSRPLQKFNGHIGFCTQHKWVSPAGLGYEAEAAEQNRLDREAAEQQRLAEERRKAEEESRQRQERHAAAVRKAIIAVMAVLAVIAAVVLLLGRPSLNYGSATDKLAAGDYAAARKGYEALGNYKDSKARVVLCDAMLDIQGGNTEEAIVGLDQLTADGADGAAKQLAEALLPVMSDWKAKGLTPEAMLLLLSRSTVIDPKGTLDTAALTAEAHAAMLDGDVVSSYAEDVDGDGEAELVALNGDYTVTVYRMTDEGNARIAVDNETAAACGMRFGDQFKESDPDAAVACYSEAYRLLPGDETRGALTAAYRLRSADRENAGDMDAAIADARRAMETSGAADDFTFFYDVNLRNCKNGRDAASAIGLWEAFAADSAPEIARFSAQDRWTADAARLHLALAAEYAATKDEACVDEIRTAAAMGADVTDALAEARSHFDPGLSLARLRMVELELLGDDAERERQIRSDMASEVLAAVSEWKARGVSPSDVPALIRLADAQGIGLDGIDRKAVYEEAALAAAGAVKQTSFVDWDGDGYEELLALDGEGRLSLWAAGETWGVVSEVDTKLSGASYAIMDAAEPLITAVSGDKDELLALTNADGRLTALFREAGISRYRAEGNTITFSRLLEGSIERYNDYTYEAASADARPVRTGIDWQQNDYPAPADALSAIERYFEARAYDIPDEAALLTANEAAGGFDLEAMGALPVPGVPGAVDAAAYDSEEGKTLFEVSYTSNGQPVRTWMAAVYEDGWKAAGAADSYGPGLDAAQPDYSVSLICLNQEMRDAIETKGGKRTYRMLLPTSGSLSMLWQAGEKAASKNVFNVYLYRDSLAGDALISYELQPSPNRQQTKPMFMSAGVYYVTVEARTSDAMPYSLTMQMQGAEHVEQEVNDSAATATRIEAGTAYTGSLLTSKDVDWYKFAIEETSAVSVELGTAGNGGKSPIYAAALYSAQDGKPLAGLSAPGNVQVSGTGNLYLAPGEYWIQVGKGSAWTNEPYTVTVNVSQNGAMEAERNDTPETANAAPLNEDIHGTIGQEGDVDCFAFTLDSDAVLQPRLAFDPTDSNAKTYVMTLYGDNRAELMKANIGGKESTKVIAPVALGPGSYVLKLENPRYIHQEYALRLACQPVDAAEREPNDTAALANELATGSFLTGVLTTQDDVDVYKLAFAGTTTVTLKLSYPQSTVADSVFVVSVEQNGKSQKLASPTGDSGGAELPLQFAPGEYYLTVAKGNQWSGAVYTIGIEQ